MEGAAYYFNHVGFNKRDITPDFPARHLHYTLRQDKAIHVESNEVAANFFAARQWLNDRMENSRANARVFDRFIVNLPYSLSHEQRVGLVRDYMQELTQGKVRFIWAIHGDTDAPHAHAVLVDKHLETGKRHIKTSDIGSSYKLRMIWQTCCNKALEAAGVKYRVSRWGKDSEEHKRLNELARQPTYKPAYAATTSLASPPSAADVASYVPTTAAAKASDILEPVVEKKTWEEALTDILDVKAKLDYLTMQLNARTLALEEKILADRKRNKASADISESIKNTEILRQQWRKAEEIAASYRSIKGRLQRFVFHSVRERAKDAELSIQIAEYRHKLAADRKRRLFDEIQRLDVEIPQRDEKLAELTASQKEQPPQMELRRQALQADLEAKLGAFEKEHGDKLAGEKAEPVRKLIEERKPREQGYKH